jgi:hypothetical protein
MRKHGIFVPAVGCVEAGNAVLNDLSGLFILECKIQNHEPTPALVLLNVFHLEMGLANIGAKLRLKPHFF